MVGARGGLVVIQNPTLVIPQRTGINSGRDGSTRVNLGLDRVHVVGTVLEETIADLTVFGDGGIGEVVEFDAFSAGVGEAGAGAAGVDGRAGGVDLGAESFLGFVRAC